MAGVLDTVDQRTQLVGENRLELLMFRLHGDQRFAINVFKVQEVQQMPKLTMLPKRHPMVVGVTHVRGNTIPVIDLSLAIGMTPLDDYDSCNIIIAEYNMSVQAFMVRSVDRIVNLNWEQIQPPPTGSGHTHFLTAITQIQDSLVEIIDVEKVLAQVRQYSDTVSNSLLQEEVLELTRGMRVFLVDDSSTAISQAKGALSQLGIEVHSATDGAKGLAHLKKLADDGVNVPEFYALMITDAEMPEMDGYRLTTECRNDPRLHDLFIVMHTSLSGSFNTALSAKVGVNDFISKFQPDELATLVQNRIKQIKGVAS